MGWLEDPIVEQGSGNGLFDSAFRIHLANVITKSVI
jgi:hypothetical protein